MITGAAGAQAGEDLVEGAAPDLSLRQGRQREIPFGAALEKSFLLQSREETLEIEGLIQVSLLLQVPHPLDGLLGVATAGQEQLVEEALQIESSQKLLDELGIEMEVSMSQLKLPSPKSPR